MKAVREVFWTLVFLADRGEDEAGRPILRALALLAVIAGFVWLLVKVSSR
jgi:hypothetical protein